MSDETVVEADGIRVTKSFDAEGFPVPAVRFDVTSTRDDETTLTIIDEIPSEFDIDQIGFHPEYGSEHWTATGEGVVRFERSIDADEEFTTVYGVRMGEGQEPSAFLDTPTVTVGDEAPKTGIEDVVPPESSDIVRELAGGKRDSIPGLEEEEPIAAEAEAETEADVAEANEPLLDALHQDEGEIVDAEAVEPAVTAAQDGASETEESEETEPMVAEVAGSAVDETEAGSAMEAEDEEPTPATETSAEPEAESTPETAPEPEAGDAAGISAADVAAELADQIRNGEIDDDDLSALREELAPKRSSVQLEHLQSRVSEMEAYADALGAFIDENGDARGILEDLQSDVESMESDVNALQASAESASSDRQQIRDALDDIEATLEILEDVDDRLDRVAGDVDALDERVEGVEESVTHVDELSDDLDDLRAEMRELKEWRDQLSDVFGGA